MVTRIRAACWGTFVAVALAVAATGCGGGGGKGDLTGTVTLNTKPVMSGTVQVFTDNGVTRTGEIGPDGKYTITEVPAGVVKVSVTSPNPQRHYDNLKQMARTEEQKSSLKTPDPAVVKGWKAVPTSFEDPNTSGLTATVKRGANTFDIAMTGQAPGEQGGAAPVLPGRVTGK